MQPPAFTVDRLGRLAEMGRDHFWISGRRALLAGLCERWLPNAGARVLEVGLGSGESLRDLAARGYAVFGVDLLPAAVARARLRAPAASLSVGDIERLEFASGSFDAVIAFDVLEHADDDLKAARELRRVLAPGGRALLAAPAGPWLWGVRDVDAGHRRRYTKPALTALFEEAGLAVDALRYHQFLLFPLLVASRLAGRRRRALRDLEDLPPAPLNGVLAAASRLDSRLTLGWSPPWGSSLIAVCARP